MNINIEKINGVTGGYEIGDMRYIVNSEDWDDTFLIKLGTGTAWVSSFIVNSGSVEEAVSVVIEFCEENEFKGYYLTFDEMTEWQESDQDYTDTLEHAEAHGYYFDGDTNSFIELLGIEKLGD